MACLGFLGFEWGVSKPFGERFVQAGRNPAKPLQCHVSWLVGSPLESLYFLADVLAWLATIANVAGIDLAEEVTKKYGTGCPGCGHLVCTCADEGKP